MSHTITDTTRFIDVPSLQLLRELKGLSIEQLAHRIGVHPKTLDVWETMRTVPSPSDLHLIAQALDVHPNSLTQPAPSYIPPPPTPQLHAITQQLQHLSMRVRQLEHILLPNTLILNPSTPNNPHTTPQPTYPTTLIQALISLLEHNNNYWKGTATELLNQLAHHTDERTRRQPLWPQNPLTLSHRLRKLRRALQHNANITMSFAIVGHNKLRMISLERYTPKT